MRIIVGPGPGPDPTEQALLETFMYTVIYHSCRLGAAFMPIRREQDPCDMHIQSSQEGGVDVLGFCQGITVNL